MSSIESCEDPSLVLGGLCLWVLGKAYPDNPDWWDRDVLQVRAECRAPGSVVSTSGALLRSDEIADLLAGMEAMHKWETKFFDWKPREPNLAMRLSGSLTVEVEITPDHLMQRHQFRFDLDLTYLLPPIGQCRQILRSFPVTVGGRSYPVRISN